MLAVVTGLRKLGPSGLDSEEVADGVLSWQAAVVVEVGDVRRVCLGLPGVSERESWGQPAWFARRMLARIWDDGILTVKTDERDALTAQDPDTYSWTPHHDRSPLLLLVRMDRIDELTLRELLNEAHRLAS